MRYTLSFDSPNQQYIEVTLKVKPNSDQMIVRLPSWRPGRYQLGDFAKNVSNFSVVDQQGKPLSFKKTDKSSWSIACEHTDELIIHYKYYAAELNAGSTYLDENQLYVNPVNCMLYVEGYENQKHMVQLDLPSQWIYAGPLQFTDNHFSADNFDELADSPFICSSQLQYRTYKVANTTFYVWFNGLIFPDWKKLIDDFKRFSKTQIEKFIEFPTEEYHFLFQILPYKVYHGVEHKRCTVITLGPSYAVFNELYTELLGVSSHELYHTWNVKAIRPADWFPYDFSKENYSEMGYLAEGVTTYMGDLMLFKSGVFDEKQFFKELGNQMQKHFDNFGRFNYSVAASSWDTWLDGYEIGAPNRKVSIYTEGALLAFVSDVFISKSTDNKKKLDDVMRHLYFDFAQQEKGVTEQDYKAVLENVSGSSFDWLFDQYYYGTKAYEGIIHDALDYLGLELVIEPSEDTAASELGLKIISINGVNVVKAIYPGSVSDLAGVMLEDEIIGLNNIAVTNDFNRWIDFFKNEQKELTIKRKNQVIKLMLPELNRTFYKKYRIQKVAQPTPTQKRAFDTWKS